MMQQLNVDTDMVEELLIGLILEGRIEGRIDQVGMLLELESKYVLVLVLHELPFEVMVHRQSLRKKRYSALDKWSTALDTIHSTVIGKNHSGSRGDYGYGMGDAFGP